MHGVLVNLMNNFHATKSTWLNNIPSSRGSFQRARSTAALIVVAVDGRGVINSIHPSLVKGPDKTSEC